MFMFSQIRLAGCGRPDKMSAFVRPNLQKPNAKWMGKAEMIWSGDVGSLPCSHSTHHFLILFCIISQFQRCHVWELLAVLSQVFYFAQPRIPEVWVCLTSSRQDPRDGQLGFPWLPRLDSYDSYRMLQDVTGTLRILTGDQQTV